MALALTRDGSASPICFDHNATTPVHPTVLEAMMPYLGEVGAVG